MVALSITDIPLYKISQLGKEFSNPTEKVVVFKDITLDIHKGETLAIVGASGSGKSSFLHILGSLANPSWGDIEFLGEDLVSMSSDRKAFLRNSAIGFVFQFHHLLPEFSTLENVAMPAIIAGKAKDEAFDRARAALQQVGLTQRESYDVTLLSGGERQRAAIARAVIQRPAVLLADEPTGNLDAANGRMITELMLELNAEYKMALVVVTHNTELAACMGRQFELKSGELYEQTK